MRLALGIAIVVGVTGCPDSDPMGGRIDAAPPVDAPIPFVACDPLTPSCPQGQKCTFVEANGRDGMTACSSEGDVAAKDPCVQDPIGGGDDCQSGLFCLTADSPEGICTEICDTTTTTCTTGTCTADPDLFTDADNTGLCQP